MAIVNSTKTTGQVQGREIVVGIAESITRTPRGDVRQVTVWNESSPKRSTFGTFHVATELEMQGRKYMVVSRDSRMPAFARKAIADYTGMEVV